MVCSVVMRDFGARITAIGDAAKMKIERMTEITNEEMGWTDVMLGAEGKWRKRRILQQMEREMSSCGKVKE